MDPSALEKDSQETYASQVSSVVMPDPHMKADFTVSL
jgi:hypothetical protein